MSTDTFINTRVSFWQQACLLGLITAFVVMGTLRLNDCDLFNPDSPRYVIYSKAIIDLGAYRATDLPGAPLYSWRPPGLSMLLAPVMVFRPYDVVAAKVVILLTGALLLWVVFNVSSLHCSGWAALLVTAVVASSPTFFVMSTEVLTEVPYTLGVLIVLSILSRTTMTLSDQQQVNSPWLQRLTMAIAIAALAFTPWLRTVGISLVAAVGLWAFASRSRFQWFPAFGIAAAAFGLLAWRNKLAGGGNYIGSTFFRIREQGPGAVIESGLDTIWHYTCAVPGLLLPGISSERPWYSPLTIDGSPTLSLPYLLVACGAALMLSLGMLGMCNRRAHGGSLALLYVFIYCACLIVWPWRHERFLWPLVPVVLSYVPIGVSVASTTIPFMANAISFCGTIFLVALGAWQTVGCHQIVDVNREFQKDREAFHATRYPGFYFSNWRRAGEWLNENTPPTARVLTWHAAVAGTSHRFQRRVPFETLTPEKLRQQIESFSAKYLVVPDANFGDGFGWQQLAADPAIRLDLVYREQDVAILEINPNRTGHVSKDAYPQWLESQCRMIETARNRHPRRTDLAIRYATLLNESGKTAEAEMALRDLLQQGVRTARVCSELGWLLFDSRQFAEAATYLEMASKLPNAESIAESLLNGASLARERMHDRTRGTSEQLLERKLNRIKSQIGSLKYAVAERELNQLAESSVDHPQIVYLRGRLYHRLGDDAQAEICYEKALRLSITDATQWLLEIRYREALTRDSSTVITAGDHQETIDPSVPETYVRVAKHIAECGWTGRGLAILEVANQRYPDDRSIQLALADALRYFASPDLAVPLYLAVLKTTPDDESAQIGLVVAQSRLLEPTMFPLKVRKRDDRYVQTRN